MTGKIKRMLLLNLPYVLIALLVTKLCEAWRNSPGLDISPKVLHLMDGFALAFRSPWPSLLPQGLILSIVIAAAIKLAVYVKGRNAKEYRKNIDYGSAGKTKKVTP
ncbi:conjugal transfer protein TraG [Proteiniclasticum sp. QWL-01]|uniref:conjugal transfer protein TraG n=1 Tax=Proteiniclasticum sp. QWL-01 TaxID=3036945 RepID=UPI002410DE33|nr:conjugal transfer protein TraG [Proteiniclasticum sp. QWL-01]WFF73438.1 conjugal transfer protein TraG [Proteiniclasticum sp. QWL-01]